MTKPTLLSKITLKAIGAQPRPHTLTERTLVAEVYGSARRYSVGSTTFGSFVKFHGDFEATNSTSGEAFRSPALLLPELAQELIVSALNNAGATASKIKSAESKAITGESASSAVDFAFAIICVPIAYDSPSTTGYKYQIEPIVEPTGADPLAALRDRVKGVPAHEDVPVHEGVPVQDVPVQYVSLPEVHEAVPVHEGKASDKRQEKASEQHQEKARTRK